MLSYYNEPIKGGKGVSDYIINERTLAIIGVDYNFCRVLEKTDEFLVSKGWQEILSDSCLYYSSSLQGRIDGSRTILNKEYKVPIILQEAKSLIFFPIGNQTDYNCIWISLKNLNSYTVTKGEIRVLFKGNKDLLLMTGLQSFEGQLLKSYNLEKILISRQEK